MKIRPVTNLSFKGKIIDSHVHLGKWGPNYYAPESLDVFINSKLSNGDTVEKMIVSNSSCIDNDGILDELAGNKQMLDFASKNSKIAPLAVCQPKLTNGNAADIDKLLKENPHKFVGLKFHPKCMELPANDHAYDSYMDVAQKYKLPCLFHTDKTFSVTYSDGSIGTKCEYSRPEQVYDLAKRHKDVPVIFAHMGGNDGDNAKAAVDIIIDSIESDSAKLYADISWVNPDVSYKEDIVKAIKRLKNTSKGDMTNRLLFGTDAPIGRFGKDGENGLQPYNAYSKVVDDIKTSIKLAFPKEEAEEIIDKIFYRNAYNLFFQENESQTSVVKTISNNNKKVYAVAAVIIGVLSASGILLKNKLQKNTSK